MIRVPRPGGLSIVSCPSRAPTRSARPRSPLPRSGVAPPWPSSRISMCASLFSRPTVTHASLASRVLGDVGERLGDDEVGGGLDVPGESARCPRPPAHRRGRAPAARACAPRRRDRCRSKRRGGSRCASSRSSFSACWSSRSFSSSSSSEDVVDVTLQKLEAHPQRRAVAVARRRAGRARAAAAPRRRP